MPEKYRGFENAAGRRSRVRIEKGEKLGEGSMSDVHAVKARVQLGEDKKVLESLVVKKYKGNNQGLEWARETAEASLKNYALLKGLDFPVPPTYRLDRESNRILMTNLNTLYPETVNLSTSLSADLPEQFIRDISNFEDVVREAIGYADAATAKHIDLGADAYTLVVPRSGIGEGKIFFTDMDSVSIRDEHTGIPLERLRQDNLEEAQAFFVDYLVKLFVPEELRPQYFNTLDKIFSEKKSAAGVPRTETDAELEKYRTLP